MNLQDIVFVILCAIIIFGALMAVAHKNIFYNALSLILCLFGIAGVFIYLNSEFLAVMEVIIYIGAISIAIIFAIMLSQTYLTLSQKPEPLKLTKALLVGVALFVGILKVVHKTSWPLVSPEGNYSIKEIGRNLLTTNALGFEVVSLVLLVAIIGALLISNKEAA